MGIISKILKSSSQSLMRGRAVVDERQIWIAVWVFEGDADRRRKGDFFRLENGNVRISAIAERKDTVDSHVVYDSRYLIVGQMASPGEVVRPLYEVTSPTVSELHRKPRGFDKAGFRMVRNLVGRADCFGTCRPDRARRSIEIEDELMGHIYVCLGVLYSKHVTNPLIYHKASQDN
jgi:hypothetical protein